MNKKELIRQIELLVKDDEKSQETIIKQSQEIKRLNNIINELEEILIYEKNDYNGNLDIETRNIDSEFLRGNAFEADYILGKLQELKGSDSNE